MQGICQQGISDLQVSLVHNAVGPGLAVLENMNTAWPFAPFPYLPSVR